MGIPIAVCVLLVCAYFLICENIVEFVVTANMKMMLIKTVELIIAFVVGYVLIQIIT